MNVWYKSNKITISLSYKKLQIIRKYNKQRILEMVMNQKQIVIRKNSINTLNNKLIIPLFKTQMMTRQMGQQKVRKNFLYIHYNNFNYIKIDCKKYLTEEH